MLPFSHALLPLLLLALSIFGADAVRFFGLPTLMNRGWYPGKQVQFRVRVDKQCSHVIDLGLAKVQLHKTSRSPGIGSGKTYDMTYPMFTKLRPMERESAGIMYQVRVLVPVVSMQGTYKIDLDCQQSQLISGGSEEDLIKFINEKRRFTDDIVWISLSH